MRTSLLNLRLAALFSFTSVGILIRYHHAIASPVSLEYQVKGAFLFNFPKFIDWENAPEKAPKNSFSLCILGKSPFGDLFEEAAKDKLVKGLKFEVKALEKCCDVSSCQILYVSPSWKGNLSKALEQIAKEHVLTVGDAEDFNQSGGIVRFYLEEGKVRFEINREAAEKAHIKISANLLKLAKITREEK